MSCRARPVCCLLAVILLKKKVPQGLLASSAHILTARLKPCPSSLALLQPVKAVPLRKRIFRSLSNRPWFPCHG